MTGKGAPLEPGSRVLVAGASGALGRHVVEEAARRGYRARALIRDPAKRGRLDPRAEVVIADLLDETSTLDDACKDVEVVFSAAGQPTGFGRSAERSSFMATDYAMNKRLLDAALRAGVRRFVYVTVLNGPGLRHLDYVRAHEAVVDAVLASGLDCAIVRANGFFSAYLDLLTVARRGLAVIFGDGRARSNPIHEAELAVACVDAIERGEGEIEVGGPEILTRREELEQAFVAVGKRPRLLRLPLAMLRAALPALRLIDRRRAEMLAFVAEISTIEMVAPAHGALRLSDYLCEHASGREGAAEAR